MSWLSKASTTRILYDLGRAVQLVISFALALALTSPSSSAAFIAQALPADHHPGCRHSGRLAARLHPDFGILNEVLAWVGIPPQKWLLDPNLAKPAFIFMSFWMIGRQMVILSPAWQHSDPVAGGGAD